MGVIPARLRLVDTCNCFHDCLLVITSATNVFLSLGSEIARYIPQSIGLVRDNKWHRQLSSNFLTGIQIAWTLMPKQSNLRLKSKSLYVKKEKNLFLLVFRTRENLSLACTLDKNEEGNQYTALNRYFDMFDADESLRQISSSKSTRCIT